MEQINATVDCDVARLNVPLRPFYARQGHNFVVCLRRVPADCTALVLRIFKENGAYFDISCKEHASGEWSARVTAACFPAAGEFKYELHATAADDQPCAIGEGRVLVQPFSTTTTPVTPGTMQEVAQLPVEGGGFVQVVMKWDGFAWMPEAVFAATATEGGQS